MTSNRQICTPPEVHTLGDESVTIYARTWIASNGAKNGAGKAYGATASAAAETFKAQFPRVRTVDVMEYTYRDQRPDCLPCHTFGIGMSVPYAEAHFWKLPNDGGAELAALLARKAA